MSTFELSASGLAFTTINNTSWTGGRGAFQGAYGNGEPRVGAIMFGSLRDTVNWPNMVVSEVRLWLQYGGAGGNYEKTIGLYTTSRNSYGGSGRAMLGMGIGQFSSIINAYNSSWTYTFNENTNPILFARLAQWIEGSSVNGLAIYLNETRRTGDYSGNYLTITGARISIDYDVRGSNGTITPSSAEVGDTVVLDIDPLESESVVSHTLQWICGNYTSNLITLAGGVLSYSYQIPNGQNDSWLYQIPADSTSAQAIARLTTFVGEEQFGTRDIPFTVNVPERYAPIINSFSVQRYTSYIDDQGQTQYQASLSGNHVWINLDADTDLDNGANHVTASIRYYPVGEESSAQTASVSWLTDHLSLQDNMALIPEVIAISKAHVFELTATDGHHIVTAIARVEKSWAPLHIAGTGYGVGVGMYSDGTLQEPKFQCAWDAYFNGTMNIGVNAIKGLVDVVYPVGSIFISTQDSTDPNKELPEELFPGTSWTRIKDKFLLSAGDTYNVGDTGGSATASVPGHTHSIQGSSQYVATNAGQVVPNGLMTNTGQPQGSGTVSILPPYLVVNVWERTA